MDRSFWLKQPVNKPLFPDLLWSRPENRAFAGRLLIVGGNAYGFAAPAEAYTVAEKSGIGTARVLLPDALQKSIGKIFTAGEFAPSTPSGSFARNALSELLAISNWAEGTLLAGDIGRNSETAILLESFLSKYDGQVTVTKDVLEYVTLQPQLVQTRPNTLLVLSFSQLQKMATAMHLPTAYTFDMDLLRLVDTLHKMTQDYPLALISRHLDNFIVSYEGQVCTIPCATDEKVWRLKVAAAASVWWLQNPSQTLQALTTAIADLYN